MNLERFAVDLERFDASLERFAMSLEKFAMGLLWVCYESGKIWKRTVVKDACR